MTVVWTGGGSVVKLEFSRASGRLIQKCSARAQSCGSGGIAVVCSVTAAQTMPRMGVTCIRVQNEQGKDVETVWNTDVRRGGMTGYECRRHTVCEEICLPPGVYTAVVTFYVKNGFGSDSVTCRTNTVAVTEPEEYGD